MEDIAVGIDLGTVNTCVACYHKGNLTILENSQGGRTTPSHVYFQNKTEVMVGHFAKIVSEMKSERGIYEIKRLMGKPFNDSVVQKSLQYFLFTVISENNDPVVVIEDKEETIKKTPEELSSIILSKVKKDVETKLGCAINKAVITVPAYFNVSQREATLAAAEKAGFTVLKLLNEPTAASLKYYHQQEVKNEGYSLVYDLGGGTFDVAIVSRRSEDMQIVAVDGDSYLGGKDLDNLILDHVYKELKSQYGYSPKDERRAMRRLQRKCEEAKKDLSAFDETIICMEELVIEDEVVSLTITRDQFEAMAQDLFRRTIDILDSCIKNANIFKSDVKEVILSGGSTRIPKIQQILSEYFDGKNLNRVVNPDECVAEGAAIQAALLSNNLNQVIKDITIKDVIPLSLGTKILGGIMVFVIQRNTPIPVTKTIELSNAYNNESSMTCNVYEGERLNAKKNRLLGSFTMKVTPAPPGQCDITLKMTVDQNGILTVTAKEELNNNIKDLKVVYTRGSRSDNEVKTAFEDVRSHEEDDEYFSQFAYCYQYIIDYCEAVKYNIKNKNLQTDLQHIYELCETFEKKVEKLDDRTDLEKIKLLVDEMELGCESSVKRFNFSLIPFFYI